MDRNRLPDHGSSNDDATAAMGADSETRNTEVLVANHGEVSVDSTQLQSSSNDESHKKLRRKLGAGLGSVLSKAASLLLSSNPRSVADDIRRICRHTESTLEQRHRDGGSRVFGDEEKSIETLCLKLFLLTRK